MDDVEYDHAIADFSGVLLKVADFGAATPDFELCSPVGHLFSSILFIFFDDLLQVAADFLEGLPRDFHLAFRTLFDHEIESSELLVLGREVVAEVAAAAFLALERRARD